MTAKKNAAKKAPTMRNVRTPGSITDIINSLEVGRSVSCAERLPLDGMTDSDDVQNALKRQRSNMSSYVTRVTGGVDVRDFRVESAATMTDDKSAILAVVVVTRIT